MFGEGDYDRSEQVIRQLLDDAGSSTVDQPVVSVRAEGAEVAADWDDRTTPETYLGYARGGDLASPEPAAPGSRRYTLPARLRRNQWALSGTWSIGSEAVVLDEAGGRIAFRFHARDVNLVMGPLTRGGSGIFRVLLDGGPPGGAHGADVDDQGDGMLAGQRLYQLIRQPLPVDDRRFEIEFATPGVQAVVFTFG